MCKDKDHGGERCPSDTSDARRQRRKTSTILKERKGKSYTPPTLKEVPREVIDNLKAHAENLRAKVYATPPEGVSQEEYDAQMEEEITSFGYNLAGAAEAAANFSVNSFKAKIRKREEKLLRESAQNLDALFSEASEMLEALPDDVTPFKIRMEKDALDNLTDEEKQLAEIYTQKMDEYKQAQDAHEEKVQEVIRTNHKLYEEENRRLASAYQSLIAGIRPVGGEITHSPEADKNAIAFLKETVGAHYPSDWLKHHNENGGDNIIIAATDGRPSYQTDSLFHDTETTDAASHIKRSVFATIPDSEHDTLRKAFPDLEIVSMKVNNFFAGKIDTVMMISETTDEIYAGELVNGKPIGDGWEYRPTLNSLTLPEVTHANTLEEGISILIQPRWVREVTTNKKPIKKLSIHTKESYEKADYKPGLTTPEGIAYHEFGHRMEEVLPNNILPRQEKAFLKRRSRKSEQNWYQDMIETGALGEYGHEGGFVNKYTGREYFSGKNYEVFTTGIEHLYGGGMGGLTGNSESYLKEDLDHRAFTLGILATL